MSASVIRYIGSCGNQQAVSSPQCEYYAAPTSGNAKSGSAPTAAYDEQYQLLDVDRLPPKRPGTTRFVVISDTHEFHERLTLPDGDVLVHCGDILLSDRFTFRAWSWSRAKAFFDWIEKQSHAHKVVIAGNHDATLERNGAEEVRKITGPTTHYLEDELITVCGINIYGTPRSQGTSPNTAFQGPKTWLKTGPSSNTVPDDVPIDIVVSHQPPCTKAMREFMVDLVNQRGAGSSSSTANCDAGSGDAAPEGLLAHFCGHAHEDHGLSHYFGPNGVPTFNAAILDGKFTRERLQRVTVVDIVNPR